MLYSLHRISVWIFTAALREISDGDDDGDDDDETATIID